MKISGLDNYCCTIVTTVYTTSFDRTWSFVLTVCGWSTTVTICCNQLHFVSLMNSIRPVFPFPTDPISKIAPFLRLLLYFSRWEGIRGADNRVVNSSLPRWSVARRSWVDRCCYVISVQIQYNILGWQLSNCGFFLENQRQFFHGTK